MLVMMLMMLMLDDENFTVFMIWLLYSRSPYLYFIALYFAMVIYIISLFIFERGVKEIIIHLKNLIF